MAGALFCACAHAQKTNRDESKVLPYTLPSALTMPDGKTVRTVKQWQKQRAYLLKLFADNEYGRMPDAPTGMHYRVDSVDRNALNGAAVRSDVSVFLGPSDSAPVMHVLLYLPTHIVGKAPVFVGLNFAVVPPLSAAASTRKREEDRGPFAQLIAAGYGVATAWYGDLEADNPDGWKTGVRTTLAGPLHIQPQEWAALGVWAWGMSRIQDYLLTLPEVDAQRIIVVGHSRIGKAAPWAGANDTRFAMVVSNDSGEGGAALARRDFGETIQILNTAFPHWFVARFRDFNGNAAAMPMDQHELLSLIAPRALYVASASDDWWSDPKGEFLSAQEASKVYALYGLKGVSGSFPPPLDTSIGDRIGYHLRTGQHDIMPFDWSQYVAFANRNLKPATDH